MKKLVKVAEVECSNKEILEQIAKILYSNEFEISYDEDYPKYIYVMKRVDE